MLSQTNFNALVNRGYLIVSSGRPGSGNSRVHSLEDVLQARFIYLARWVGVPLHRAAVLWPVALGAMCSPGALLLIAHREDDSETNFRIVHRGADEGFERDDAPAAASVINLDGLVREVQQRLEHARTMH